YWDVQPARFDPLHQEWGAQLDQAVTVLRVFDITGRASEDWAAAPFFDLEITADMRQYYIHLPQSGHQYRVELGLRLPNGLFISILSSNVILLPSGSVSDDVDAQWMKVHSKEEVEEWEKILHNVDIGRGSAEFSRQMAQRWQFLKAVFSIPSSLR